MNLQVYNNFDSPKISTISSFSWYIIKNFISISLW